MNNDFNSIASQYTKSLKSLPEQYISLIANTFKLQTDSKIIDLGCGSGLLTFPLVEISDFISGLDISHNMIQIARNHPKGSLVNWIEKDVDTFKFHKSYYDLIISYESIHLFPNIKKILQHSSDGLKKGGNVCMGWCVYNWEELLKNEIVSTFNRYGVIWGEWGYQKCNKFKELIDNGEIIGLTPVKSACVEIYQEWTVVEIVSYITSISRALNLSDYAHTTIKKELIYLITKKYGDIIKGNTQFWIRYSEKR